MNQTFVFLILVVGLSFVQLAAGVCLGMFVDTCKSQVVNCNRTTSWDVLCALQRYPTRDEDCPERPCEFVKGADIIPFCNCLQDLVRTQDLSKDVRSYRLRLGDHVLPSLSTLYYTYVVPQDKVNELVR
ncbi:uncharacterized protein LOC131939612 [Physella acuta]|uniref:uncharacterized protein LOC131939612 n=1 Tax=Physella acuta TaxID=109671 RepID=UPI0027DDB56D|nr:uncharacterized protein LOC131939612 [Physella acuta]